MTARWRIRMSTAVGVTYAEAERPPTYWSLKTERESRRNGHAHTNDVNDEYIMS